MKRIPFSPEFSFLKSLIVLFIYLKHFYGRLSYKPTLGGSLNFYLFNNTKLMRVEGEQSQKGEKIRRIKKFCFKK